MRDVRIKDTFRNTLGINYMEQVISSKNGSIALMGIVTGITLNKVVHLITQGLELAGLLVPLFIFALLTIVFAVVTAFDFMTGMVASKRRGVPIKSSLLYRTMFKFLGVFLTTSIVTVFSIVFLIMEMNIFHNMFTVAIISLYLIAILFEIHSIGENQERAYGVKPRFYRFFDDITDAIELGIINKIKKYFNNGGD